MDSSWEGTSGHLYQEEWVKVQDMLKQKLVLEDDFTWTLSPQGSCLDQVSEVERLQYIGGVDVSFVKEDPSLACGALVILDASTLNVVHEEFEVVRLKVPYAPGFLAFREAPIVLRILDKMKQNSHSFYPQLLMVDGNGILHPRGFGLACHLGVLANLPAIGIGKNLFTMVRTRGGHTSSSGSEIPSTSAHVSDGRPYVGNIINKSFADKSVSRQIGQNIRANFSGPWGTFNAFSLRTRELLWQLFQSQYSWPMSETPAIRMAWEATSTRMVTQILGRERGYAEHRMGSDTNASLKGHGPEWIPMWDSIVDQLWSTAAWKEKSDRAKKNRQTQKEGSITKHSGGSISFASHHAQLEKELGRPPTKQELFLRTHQKKGTTEYIDAKSRAVTDNYERMIIEKHGATPTGELSFDPTIWVEAAGGLTKGRVYGFGGHGYGVEGSTSSSGAHRHQSSHESTRCYTREEIREIFRELIQEEELRKSGKGESREGADEAEEGDDETEEEV